MSNFTDYLLRSISEVYPPDDVDRVTRRFKNKEIRKTLLIGVQKPKPEMDKVYQQSNYEMKFRKHPLTLLSSFLGLPNRDLENEGQSFKNLGKNLVGWRSKNNILLNFGNLVFNLAMVPLITLLNIIKIPTELLPAIGMASASYVKDKASKTLEKKESKGLALGLVRLKYGFAMLAEKFFKGWYSIGSFITSPIRSLRRSNPRAQRDIIDREPDAGGKGSSVAKIMHTLKPIDSKIRGAVKTATLVATLPITSPIIVLSLMTEIASIRNIRTTYTAESDARRVKENNNTHAVSSNGEDNEENNNYYYRLTQ